MTPFNPLTKLATNYPNEACTETKVTPTDIKHPIAYAHATPCVFAELKVVHTGKLIACLQLHRCTRAARATVGSRPKAVAKLARPACTCGGEWWPARSRALLSM